MVAFLEVPENVSDRQTLEGVVYLRNINYGTTHSGSTYASGTLLTQGGKQYQFKKWSTDHLDAGAYQVNSRWNVYKGTGSIIIDTVTPIDMASSGISMADFLPSVYDADKLWNDLLEMLRNNVSEKGMRLFNLFVFGRDGRSDVEVERFKNEFAAIYHHDNVPHGLLAHSYKVGRILVNIVNDPLYPFHSMSQEFKDIVIVGGTLHDFGKIYEYMDGEIANRGQLLSHRTWATIRLAGLHGDITTNLYGSKWYYRLMSIFEQHHGEYEETPRTLEAYLVHLADAFEANVTSCAEGLNEALSSPTKQTNIAGFKLTV